MKITIEVRQLDENETNHQRECEKEEMHFNFIVLWIRTILLGKTMSSIKHGRSNGVLLNLYVLQYVPLYEIYSRLFI